MIKSIPSNIEFEGKTTFDYKSTAAAIKKFFPLLNQILIKLQNHEDISFKQTLKI